MSRYTSNTTTLTGAAALALAALALAACDGGTEATTGDAADEVDSGGLSERREAAA